MRATWLIAATILAVVWVPVAILPVAPWVYALPAILSVGVIAGTVAYDRRTAAGNAELRKRALEHALSERMRAANPEQQLGITTMREDLRDAVSKLTGAAPGQAARRVVDALPWYLVIGPSQSGKSSMLASSGETFGYVTPAGGARGGRGCRFWLTQHAAYIDTGGEYVTGAAAYAEWLAFLRELESTRPAQPLHGIVVTLAADQVLALLAAQRGDELDALGKTLRERVDEALGFLGVDVPVYLVVTRCDGLQGFMEYFADLRGPERGQVLGFTLPLRGKDDPAAMVSARFDDLARDLSHRMYRRVMSRAHTEARGSTYMFPQWFAGLKPGVTAVASRLFARNRFMDQVTPRGVFFTSAAEATTLQGAEMPYASAPTGERGFFLRDLLRNVLLPDREHARPSASELLRRVHRTLALAAPLLGVAIVTPVLAWHAYRENVELLQDFDRALEPCAQPRVVPSLAQLDTLRATVDRLRVYQRDGAPTHMRVGMYVGDDVYDRESTAYAALVNFHYHQRIWQRVHGELSALARRYAVNAARPSDEERLATQDNLRLYLMLTTPRQADDPQLSEAAQRAWFIGRVKREWPPVTGADAMRAEAAQVAVLELYALILAGDQRQGFRRELELVTRIRTILGRS